MFIYIHCALYSYFRYWETKITLETVETVEEVTYIPTTPKEVHHADESSADLDVETVEEHVESEQVGVDLIPLYTFTKTKPKWVIWSR